MTTRASLPSFSAIFDQSFAAFKERFWIFLVLWLISGVAYAVSGALGALALKVFAPLVIIPILAGLWVSGWTLAAQIMASREQIDLGDVILEAAAKAHTLVWVEILEAAAAIGGLFLLIVPGVYLGLSLTFAPFAVIEEGLTGFDALDRSHELVAGRWWSVATLLFFAMVPSMLLGKIPWAGWLLGSLAYSFLFLFALKLYRCLKLEGPPVETTFSSKLFFGMFALVGCVGSAAAVAAGTPLVLSEMRRQKMEIPSYLERFAPPPAPPPEIVAPLAAEAPAPSAPVPAAAPALDYPEACKAELAMFCEGRADKGAAACLALVPDGLLAPCKDALARLGAAN